MSTINRVTKQGSGTTEFQAGTTILSGEVNTDFDTIYHDYDGNIDNTNIAPNAGIVYPKLNLSNSIVNADINTNAGIVGTKLADAPLGIITSKINDGAVTLPKVAIGASTRNFSTATFTPVAITGTTVESLPLVLLTVTTSGGLCMWGIDWAASSTYTSAVFGSNTEVRVKIDGTTVSDRSYIIKPDATLDNKMPIWLPTPTMIDAGIPAGSHTWIVTVQLGDASTTFNLISGTFWFVEFA